VDRGVFYVDKIADKTEVPKYTNVDVIPAALGDENRL